MAMLMLCMVLAATCRGCGVWRRTRIQLQRLSIMPVCRYTLGCRVPLPATCISWTSTVCGSEQGVTWISRYICFCHQFRCRCVRKASRTAVCHFPVYSSHLQLPIYVTYSAGHFEEMQSKNLGGIMPLIHVLWYLAQYRFDCGHADAVVVVDDTPALTANIARSDESGGDSMGLSGCVSDQCECRWRCSTACQHHAVHLGSRSDGAGSNSCNLGYSRRVASAWHSTVGSGQLPRVQRAPEGACCRSRPRRDPD